jgi:type IV pilus assembly protein PilQ
MALVALALGGDQLGAFADDPLKLESIDVQTLSGQQVQLKLHLSGPAPEPLPFTIDKPARIAFDLPNTTLALGIAPHRRALGRRRHRARGRGQWPHAPGRQRRLADAVHHQGRRQHISSPSAASRAPRPSAQCRRRAAGTRRRSSGERAIRTIDFRRGADGTGRVIVQLSDPRNRSTCARKAIRSSSISPAR